MGAATRRVKFVIWVVLTKHHRSWPIVGLGGLALDPSQWRNIGRTLACIQRASTPLSFTYPPIHSFLYRAFFFFFFSLLAYLPLDKIPVISPLDILLLRSVTPLSIMKSILRRVSLRSLPRLRLCTPFLDSAPLTKGRERDPFSFFCPRGSPPRRAW